MREDLKLMRISFILGIFSLLVLITFSICIYSDLCCCLSFKIASYIMVSISAGVGGSCITLFLTKLFDYRQKRKDKLIEYLGLTLLFYEYTKGIKPIIKDNDREHKSYSKYYDHPDLPQKISQAYRNLYFGFSKKDKIYRTLASNIFDVIEKTRIDLNRICVYSFGVDAYFGSIASKNAYLTKCTKNLFKIYPTKTMTLYTNKFSTNLVRLLNKLQKLLYEKSVQLIPENVARFYYTKDYLEGK